MRTVRQKIDPNPQLQDVVYFSTLVPTAIHDVQEGTDEPWLPIDLRTSEQKVTIMYNGMIHLVCT